MDDGREVEVQGSTEKFEGRYHDDCCLCIETLEEVGDESEQRKDCLVTKVAQLDLLGD